jgi:hypothetical protein
MLSGHSNNLAGVIGKWTNIRVEGARLLAEPVFDQGDEGASSIAGKVERGFIKACSMGLLYLRENMKLAQDGIYDLIKSELLEVSIVAIPSNANALRLFTSSGLPLSENEISLSLAQLKSLGEAYVGGLTRNKVTLDEFQAWPLEQALAFKRDYPTAYSELINGDGAVQPLEVNSVDDFASLSLKDALAFKKNNPAAYYALFGLNEYGMSPKQLAKV